MSTQTKATAQELRAFVNTYKLALGCQDNACQWTGAFDPAQLQLDHIDPSTKYTTRNGKVMHPSDMVTKRYALNVIIAELHKCRVVCANCHATHTHRNQR